MSAGVGSTGSSPNLDMPVSRTACNGMPVSRTERVKSKSCSCHEAKSLTTEQGWCGGRCNWVARSQHHHWQLQGHESVAVSLGMKAVRLARMWPIVVFL
eukprot:92277-Chlamydomonas_euryale.AAC.3